ncbi:hypothetical protein Dsin_001561 [Dipteronia sinensis]|uniref:RRM domain-containing protein n=1 Tax=Dipteronia sinensis TaxID=43782 RepID=A0AAE0B5H9_9ROSI|nr:hypothetical protein Dsin_001561 [Dipteronia sinensis]
MSDNSGCAVYIGNLDERVSERVLYDIMIQAGRVLDLHVPRDRETDKPKGFAFAEYESQEIADYAVKLFSGIVVLHNRTIKFAISGQDKNSQNLSAGLTSSSHRKSRTDPVPVPSSTEILDRSMRKSDSFRATAYPGSNYSSQEPPPPGVTPQSHGYGSRSNDTNSENSRRVFGSSEDSISRTRSRRYDTSNLISYPHH